VLSQATYILSKVEGFNIAGGTINGSLIADSININGGVVKAPLIKASGSVYIGTNAKVYAEDFQLTDGAKLVIDGTLVLPADFDCSDWECTVTGTNAGSLAGTWPRQTTQPQKKWYQKIWNWIKYYILFGWIWMVPTRSEWVLRYICFGWIWMK